MCRSMGDMEVQQAVPHSIPTALVDSMVYRRTVASPSALLAETRHPIATIGITPQPRSFEILVVTR